MEQNKRKCIQCGSVLRTGNKSNLCSSCTERKTKGLPYSNRQFYDERYYDLRQVMELLGLSSYEQARRKAQHGEIPGQVPAIRRYLFSRDVVDNWLREGSYLTNTRKLSDESISVLEKLGDTVNALEERLPISRVVETFEKQIPIQEVAKGIIQFVQEAPPPDVVLNNILKSFLKK